jgi:hypothetical protein
MWTYVHYSSVSIAEEVAKNKEALSCQLSAVSQQALVVRRWSLVAKAEGGSGFDPKKEGATAGGEEAGDWMFDKPFSGGPGGAESGGFALGGDLCYELRREWDAIDVGNLANNEVALAEMTMAHGGSK